MSVVAMSVGHHDCACAAYDVILEIQKGFLGYWVTQAIVEPDDMMAAILWTTNHCAAMVSKQCA